VKPNPDAKQRRRVEARLRGANDPRSLYVQGRLEPGLSRADEDEQAQKAHRRNRTNNRAELQRALATITTELEFVERRLGQVAPGDHRDAIRFARRAIAKLNRTLER
jgi:hypothetical protein